MQEDNNGRPDGLCNASKKKDSDQYCENSLGKEKDQINQLRREFKAAIKDLRNDVGLSLALSSYPWFDFRFRFVS